VNGELVFAHAGFGAEAVPYLAGWELQRRLHGRRAAGEIGDTCLLLEHQPVYTAGKRTSPLDRPLTDPGIPVIDVDRGGKITWHGPGQLVGYPIVRLADPIDVISYVRALEEALIRSCAEAGVATTRVDGRSGVWVTGPRPGGSPAGSPGSPGTPAGSPGSRPGSPGSPAGSPGRKVAAIGIRVSRGVTMHGFALNCDCDLGWFDRIVPCGIRDAGVTSLSAETGAHVAVAAMIPIVERHLAEVLGATSWRAVPSTDPLLRPAALAPATA
jgi:lipoyl(octanoyl) transferase